jgi:serine/threonine-protein kinase
MSPEQIDPSSVVDFRSDLWSLAVIACECLTGRRPFESDTLASLAMKISLSRSEKPSSLGPVPRGFDAWFVRGTEVVPQRRFDSALELAASLRELVEGGGSVSGEPSKVPQPTTTRHDLTPSVHGLASRAAPLTDAGTDVGRGRHIPEGGILARLRAHGGALAASVGLVGAAAGSWLISRPPAGETAVHSLVNGGSQASASSLPAPAVIAAPLPAPAASAQDAGAAAPRSSGSKPTARSERTSTHSEVVVAPPPPRAGSALEPAASARRSRARRIIGAHRTSPAKLPASKPAPPKPPVDPYDLL